MNIVKVRYFSDTTKELSSREYTYYTEDALQVGEVVTVPVRDTTGKAMVSAVNVAEAEIEAFKDKVKVIPAKAAVAEKPEPLGNFAETLEAPIIDRAINLCDTCLNRGDYPICEGDDVEFGEGRGNDNIIKCSNYDTGFRPRQEEPAMSYEDYLDVLEEDMEEEALRNFEETPVDRLQNLLNEIDPKGTKAVIKINPRDNPAIASLQGEIVKLRDYATFRVITCDTDLTPITDDLALIAKLKKAIKEKQDEYVKPIKEHLDKVQFVFKDLLACLDDVDKTNREKIAAYRNEQKRKAEEAEELNRQAMELARKQAEFSGTGEHTVDLTPMEAPAPVHKVSTDMGTVSTAKVWKYEIIDPTQIPEEYKVIDYTKITKVVKAGLRNIPGVRIYSEDTIRVCAR